MLHLLVLIEVNAYYFALFGDIHVPITSIIVTICCHNIENGNDKLKYKKGVVR